MRCKGKMSHTEGPCRKRVNKYCLFTDVRRKRREVVQKRRRSHQRKNRRRKSPRKKNHQRKKVLKKKVAAKMRYVRRPVKSQEAFYIKCHIKTDQPGSHNCRWFLSQFSTDFHEILKTSVQKKPNSPENFVKLYSVFQKLDHFTFNKLKLRRFSIILLHAERSTFCNMQYNFAKFQESRFRIDGEFGENHAIPV